MKRRLPSAGLLLKCTDRSRRLLDCPRRRRTGAGGALALAVALCWAIDAAAQPVPAPQAAQAIGATAEPSDETVTLVYYNRPIVSLRARVLGRRPGERALAAQRVLDDLVDEHITGPVDVSPFEAGVIIRVGSRGVLALTQPDVDQVQGETVTAVAAQAAARLQLALNEASEARTPWLL